GRVEQSWRVLKELGDVSNRLLTAELRQRNYLLSRDESELEMSHAAAGAITRELEDLRQLTRDNPTHQQRLTALASLVAKAEAERQKTIDLRHNQRGAVALPQALEGQDKQALNDISQIIAEMEGEEQELLRHRHEALGTTSQRMILLVGVRNFLALIFVAV